MCTEQKAETPHTGLFFVNVSKCPQPVSRAPFLWLWRIMTAHSKAFRHSAGEH